MSNRPPKDAPVPHAVYGCCIDDCAENASYRPSELFWIEGIGWMCEACIDDYADLEDDEELVSLEEFLRERDGGK